MKCIFELHGKLKDLGIHLVLYSSSDISFCLSSFLFKLPIISFPHNFRGNLFDKNSILMMIYRIQPIKS